MRLFIRVLVISVAVFAYGCYACITEGFSDENLKMAGGGLGVSILSGFLVYFFNDAE